jgi:hypothetical protein
MVNWLYEAVFIVKDVPHDLWTEASVVDTQVVPTEEKALKTAFVG